MRSTGIDRIRYTSPHPKDIREDVIRAHAELPAVCEHIHLPLQSGSSTILKRMRRTYNRERYLDRVAQIREHVPDCALTTDIIVGFPGETDADFEETMEVVDAVRYDGAFTFLFSPRRGTEAAEMDDQVPQAVKKERLERLVDRVQEHARERSQRFVGRTMEVLVEGTEPHRPIPSARPQPPQQGGELRRHRRRPGSWCRSTSRRPARRPSSAPSGSSAAFPERPVRLLAIFGPTAVGKTAVAIAVAEILRARGEDPVAVSCDSIQVYRGLEVLSGAASAAEQEQLEHRLLSFVDVRDEYSAGRFAEEAQPLIDGLLEEGRRPILVGGTGLYLRAAVSELELRPPVDPGDSRRGRRRGSRSGAWRRCTRRSSRPRPPASPRGTAPASCGPIELQRAGHSPAPAHEQGGELWTARPRHPTLLAGLTMDRAELDRRISERVDRMLAEGASRRGRGGHRRRGLAHRACGAGLRGAAGR